MQSRLEDLEERYRAAAGSAAAAKAHYVALCEARCHSSVELERARLRWTSCESRRRMMAARMGEHETAGLESLI